MKRAIRKGPASRGVEAGVADQGGGDGFGRDFVAAINQARARGFLAGFIDVEQHLAGDRVEGADNVRFGEHAGEFLGAGIRVGDYQRGVVFVHGEGAGQDHFAGEIAGLIEHVTRLGAVNCQENRIRVLGGLAGGARAGVGLRLARKGF